MNMYQARLMDYFQHPRNKGVLEHADFSSDQYNPSCGDSVSMHGMIRDGRIYVVTFDGRGCVISQAIASMLTESAVGKSVDEVMAWRVEFVQALLGTALGPTRLKCALLPLQALQSALSSYIQKGS